LEDKISQRMIVKTHASEVYESNIRRTNSLINAMDKIKALDRLYQEKTYAENYEMGRIVAQVQNEAFTHLQLSCAQHAIISLATAFETYLKELLQELLFKYGDYFCKTETSYSKKVEELIKSPAKNDYEAIAVALQLRGRYDYIDFFEEYSINLFSAEDKKLFEYIYLYRNCFVHNGNKIDAKTARKIQALRVVKDEPLPTQSKRLRTKFEKCIPKSYKEAIEFLQMQS
jgi:hypothetical protein